MFLFAVLVLSLNHICVVFAVCCVVFGIWLCLLFFAVLRFFCSYLVLKNIYIFFSFSFFV